MTNSPQESSLADTDLLKQAASTGLGKHLDVPWRRINVDPVTLQVIGGAIRAIAAEMAQLLFRMAYSNIMRESQDIGAGILDLHGRQLCESDSTPMHCGSLPAYVRGINRKHTGNYHIGDIVLHNHPYHGASHAPDYGILIPIFVGPLHIGFAGCTGHMIDIGGASPGFSVDVPDLWAEGKLIDALKIYEAGKRNNPLWDLILDNVRTPEANAGDIEAMIACCKLGERRFTALIDKYGLDTVMSACEDWMDYAENIMRQKIQDIPDGIYKAPDGFLEDDGKTFGVPLKVATRVIVKDTDIYIDLTGSAPQTETGFNCPFEGSVLPTANFAIRALLLDEATSDINVPQNDGVFRPIHVIAPKGSIYNPIYPTGCEARFVQINRIPDQVLQSFATVLPEQVTAGNSASVSAIAYSGAQTGEGEDPYWVIIEVNEGSYGGRFGMDGLDAIDNLMANTRNTPVEEIELSAPLFCERYELRDEPPAAGKWRGGLGAIKRWRFLGKTGIGSTGDNRVVDPPKGLFGGHNGKPGYIKLNPNTDDSQDLPAKISNASFKKGDRIEIALVSGAGYGDPLERDPVMVLQDVLDDLLTVEQARDDYGVVITGLHPAIDMAKTQHCRTSKSGASVGGTASS